MHAKDKILILCEMFSEAFRLRVQLTGGLRFRYYSNEHFYHYGLILSKILIACIAPGFYTSFKIYLTKFHGLRSLVYFIILKKMVKQEEATNR